MLFKFKRQHGLAIFTLLLMLMGVSCKKEQTLKQPEKPVRTMPRSAGDGKNDLLGYGFDVAGEYANSSASRFAVLDINAFQRDYPTRVEWDLSKKQVGRLVSGENATSYLSKLGLKLDGTFGFGVFKSTIKASYSSSDAFSSKYVYSSFDLLIQQRRGKLGGGMTLLKQYLHPAFLFDVQYESPEYIVSSYGTHVLTDITLGAKLQVMYRSETTNSQREKASEIGVDASVNKVFSVSVGLNYSYTEQEAKANFSQSLHYKTIGGDPAKSLIGEVAVGNQVPTVNIAGWQASSTVANAEMIDFNTETMIPIYEFIDDPVKKQAVIDYLRIYLRNNQPILERIYAKLVKENSVTRPGVDGVYVYSDYYVQFYREDKVSPVNVYDVTVPFLMGYQTGATGPKNYWYPAQTVRAVDTNKMYIGNHASSFKPNNGGAETIYFIELQPGGGYELMP
jgi:hypothetical protein